MYMHICTHKAVIHMCLQLFLYLCFSTTSHGFVLKSFTMSINTWIILAPPLSSMLPPTPSSGGCQ